MHSTSQPSRARLYLGVLARLLLVLGLLLAPGSLAAQPAAAQWIDPLPNKLYLPMVSIEIPRLIEPENGAVVDTLIPWLTWELSDLGGGAYACLAYGPTENPPCQEYFGPNKFGFSMRPRENLIPSTKYYWRIGIIHIVNGTERVQWQQQKWSFTTPPGSILPAAPRLLIPANNAVVPYDHVILAWEPVPGAEYYEINLWDRYGRLEGLWYFHSEYDQTVMNFSPDEFGPYLDSGVPYFWNVRAINPYGIGPESETWTFTISDDLTFPGFESPEALAAASGDVAGPARAWRIDPSTNFIEEIDLGD